MRYALEIRHPQVWVAHKHHRHRYVALASRLKRRPSTDVTLGAASRAWCTELLAGSKVAPSLQTRDSVARGSAASLVAVRRVLVVRMAK